MLAALPVALVILLVWPHTASKSTVSEPKKNYVRVCYFSNWAQYRPLQGKMVPDDIDPMLCTHYVFAFAKLSTSNELEPVEWNDDDAGWSSGWGMYSRFVKMKNKNPAIKTLLSVGGWNAGTKQMSKMLATYATRLRFAKSSIQYLRNRNFDGLDLDFEFPGNRGSPPDDRAKFLYLCNTLRVEFDNEAKTSGKPCLLLTIAVHAGGIVAKRAYNVAQLSTYVDLIHLMSYDLHGSWSDVTGHQAPLYASEGKPSVQWAASWWLSNGAPREKLVIGMPLYGRGFTLSSPNKTGVNAPAIAPSGAGTYTKQPGLLSYYEICEKITYSGCKKNWIDAQKVPYIVCDNEWIGYDDPRSLAEKTRWLKSQGFAGVMVWALPMDDFKGQFCSGIKYPLINSITRMLKCAGDACERDYIQRLKVDINVRQLSDRNTRINRSITSGKQKRFQERRSFRESDLTTDPPKLTTVAQHELNTLCMNKAEGNYAYPNNNRSFVICRNTGNPDLVDCPSDMIFTNGNCVTPPNV